MMWHSKIRSYLFHTKKELERRFISSFQLFFFCPSYLIYYSPSPSSISLPIFSNASSSSSPSHVSVIASSCLTQALRTFRTLFAFVVVFPNVSVTEDLYLIASVQSAADGFRCNPAWFLIVKVLLTISIPPYSLLPLLHYPVPLY